MSLMKCFFLDFSVSVSSVAVSGAPTVPSLVKSILSCTVPQVVDPEELNPDTVTSTTWDCILFIGANGAISTYSSESSLRMPW